MRHGTPVPMFYAPSMSRGRNLNYSNDRRTNGQWTANWSAIFRGCSQWVRHAWRNP